MASIYKISSPAEFLVKLCGKAKPCETERERERERERETILNLSHLFTVLPLIWKYGASSNSQKVEKLGRAHW